MCRLQTHWHRYVNRLGPVSQVMTIYVSSRISENGGEAPDTQTIPGDAFPGTGPRWARWVDQGTLTNLTSDGALSPATGGEYSDKPGAVIDLSAAISMVVGRQVTQNQTFRISHLSVMIENDDAGTNNHEAMVATGRFRFYSPSAHRVNAYQAYREVWRRYYRGGSSTSMAFSTPGTGGEYKALRVGISSDFTGEQVPYASNDPFTDITGTHANLRPIFNAYDAANGGDGSEMQNRLWLDGRTGHPEAVQWSAYNRNASGSGDEAMIGSFHHNFPNPLEVMCGLLHFTVDSTQSDDAFSFDDEYHIRIGIGIDGYGGEF